ncbi:polysaccharide deacetylase family protein [Nguyenibacter sp. L1]|uniref:polysaccharide deacetylase family protein n=1 Tax=Nguyenibacter sp. L1 TaxID=3049350 RepID=UPI002B484240|nr:polysaccharide deacetylase family protein [Nguyenibacter sp. L1]WRH88893.1 polysaccharide deacetylase family protein [Nguyenibacter sp. L1]
MMLRAGYWRYAGQPGILRPGPHVLATLLMAILAAASSCAAPSCMAETTGPGAIPILAYHRFDPVRRGPTTVTIAAFERQLDWLAAHRYRIVPLRQAIDILQGMATADGPVAAITADDGHVSVYTQLYPIILRRHVPVTLFLYPSAISRASYALTWAQLAEMLRSGLVSVQSHTYWHPNFRVERARLAPDAYRAFVADQLARSKSVLARRLAVPVDMLAWPFGIADPELRAAARRAGYRAAFGYGGGAARPGVDPMDIPRIPMSDISMSGAIAERPPAARPTTMPERAAP